MKSKSKVTKGNTIKKGAMIKALQKTLGIVSEACEKVKISRKTHYEWLKKDSEYKEKVDDIDEASIDFVEGKLFQKINGIRIGKYIKGKLQIYEVPPSDTAIIFFLKTKAKKRGYIEKVEQIVEHKGEGFSLVINEKKDKEVRK